MPETPPSFRAVYEDHFELVWRFAANRGVPQAELEDAVQEVFVVAHRQLLRFDGRPALRTWMAGLARNVVRNYLRRHDDLSGAGDELSPFDELALPNELGPPELLEKKSAGQLLDVILERMTERQREAFILCEIEGLSAVEAAEALGVPESTLLVRLSDARKVFNAISARLRAQRFWVSREGGNQP
jgi:RNA polymerase sigma-70 factor, ECF subfamily